MIIAIDGPAAAGKSTVARRLAQTLGLAFLDTGAMYRAVTLVALERGVDPDDEAGCAAVARELELTLNERGEILIDGRPGEPDIRSARVSRAVSQVSAHPGVRAGIVPVQRVMARRGPGVVAEGRDTTTVVFPDADHKFFLVASAEERARRRAAQLGEPEREDEIRAAIERRDELDRTRADSPLKLGPDATEVETDGRTIDEVLALLLAAVRAGSARQQTEGAS